MTDPTVFDVLALLCSPVLIAFFAGIVFALAQIRLWTK